MLDIVSEIEKLSIVLFPHPALRIQARPVQRVDAELRRMVDRMLDLMYEHRGVGLAATQVDLPLRLFVFNPSGKKGEGVEQVFINPVISRPRGNEEDEEGCLSLPGIHANVVRAKTIRVNAYEISGKEINQDFSGYEARIIQHEVDHLNGTLFIDRLVEGTVRELQSDLELLELDFASRQRTGAIPSGDAIQSRLDALANRYC